MASSSVRSPGVTVLASGVPVPGVLDVEISGNSYLAADRYRVRLALAVSGYAAWAADEIAVEIRVGLNGASASLIMGPVDRVVVDPARGEVTLDGRDLTARFIEARTQENFENQTSSDIATSLAIRRGLVPVVTPTTTLVGRNFQNDHAQTTLDQHARSTTEWDLLIRLAQLEDFDVWVAGQTLNFSPPSQASMPLVLTPQDCISMRLERSLALSSGLSVAVKSWDCRGTRAIVETASSAGVVGGNPDYVVVRPNLTQAAAQSLAKRIAGQMAQQARCISIDMPGDLTTQPRGTLALANTGTDFDGTYLISAVERHISFQSGFTQTLEARIPPWMDF